MLKGLSTRLAILEEAAAVASVVGVTGLTIGSLADRTAMSKSGLFRHFGSKEQLQVDTLKVGVTRFRNVVVRRALAAPRGLARVENLFEGWLDWATGQGFPGGCLFIAAATEMDDRPGPVRDYVADIQRDWLEMIARTGIYAVEVGDFRADLDPGQFAYEFNSILLAFHQADRLMRDPRAAERARAQFERLVRDAAS